MPRDYLRSLSLLLAAGALVASGACHRKPPALPAPPPAAPPPVVTNRPPPPPPPPAPPPAPPAAPAPLTEEQLFAQKSLADLNNEKPLDDVFFEFDKSDLGDKARASLEKDAAWLKRWMSTKVTVEGHADSRGTNEYNLALGERRATATRDYLVGLGVTGSRITTVSKGEEEPFCREENEACWLQNRRGHFVITAK